ncbi:MAG TPA: threonine synthase, partial [bacterium]|nr:threonine synthase [bacterium]
MRATGFKCLVCGKEVQLKKSLYVCPDCGGNLDVVYDYKKLSRKKISSSRELSIFRYRDLLPIQEKSSLPLKIGYTPLYKRSFWGLNNLYLKDDTKNPSASFKDRGSSVPLIIAMERKEKIVTGASTGNAGSSMACLSASVGMPCIIFVPHTAPQAKIAQLLIFGAKVVAVRGTYDEAFDLCLKVSERLGLFNRNTGYNPWTREGKKTVSFEIAEQLEWESPDTVFVPVGDGNIISGVWKGFKDLYASGLIDKLPRIVAVQSAQSNAVHKSWEKLKAGSENSKTINWKEVTVETVQATTMADSISVDLPRDGIAALRAISESRGFSLEVTDENIKETIKFLAKTSGIFAEPAGAASLAGIKEAVDKKMVKPGEKIVSLITGNGLKDIKTALSIAG